MGASAAAHAHVFLTEPGLVVVEFVEYFITHAVGGGGVEFTLTGHLVKTGDLAGGRYPAALAHLGVVAVNDIPGGEAGTGGAGHSARAAGDAAAVVLLPHGMGFQRLADRLVAEIRNGDLQFIFFHKRVGVIGLGHVLEVGKKGLIGHLNQKPIIGELQGQGVIVGAVGTHGYTKASVVAAVTVHNSELYQFPDPGVVQIIITAVAGIDAGLNPLGVDVTGAGQQQNWFCFGLAGAIFVFSKIENGLLDGSDDFFGWVIGLGVPYNVGKRIYFRIPNNIGIGVATLLGKPFWCIDTVVFLQCTQYGVRLGDGVQYLPNIVCH